MKYYIYMIENIVGSIIRIDLEANPIVLERFNRKRWYFDPEVLNALGMSSDCTNYEEITKRGAEQYIKKMRFYWIMLKQGVVRK
ncbi:hypothetical protein ES705_13249 [subsurface metagenome]